jgi:excinuclease ABC subunit B
LDYNQQHKIIPQAITKSIQETLKTIYETADETVESMVGETPAEYNVTETIRQLETEMLIAASDLEFERAATLRDRIKDLEDAKD